MLIEDIVKEGDMVTLENGASGRIAQVLKRSYGVRYIVEDFRSRSLIIARRCDFTKGGAR